MSTRTPRIVAGLIGAAALTVAATLIVPRHDTLRSFDVAIVALAYGGVFLWAQRSGFLLHWRGHATKISIEEFAMVGGLLLLPAPALVAAVGASAAANQILTRRSPMKAAFNVAQYLLAVSVAALAFGLLAELGLPELWASLVGPPVFAFVSQGSMALLFSSLEEQPFLRTFRARFLHWAAITSVIGVSLGLGAVALWTLHPLATLAVLPVFLLLQRFGRLTEWAEEEVRVHKALAEASTRLAATGDFAAVGQSIVESCASVFSAGEVRLRVHMGGRPREWSWRDPQGSGAHGMRVLVPDATGEAGELSIYPRSGQRRYAERDRNLLAIIAGSLASAGTASRSLLELHEANQRLSNANRELEEFTLWTTHDMREPLRSVAQLAHILHDDIDDLSHDEAKDLARRISKGADTLKQRIKALHEFSRIVQEDGTFAPVDANELLVEARDGLAARIQERRAIVACEGALPLVRAQPARLAKVFCNLIENALKYNDKEVPVVAVSCRDRGQEWEFSVRDNGPGIDAAFHPRAFQLFQRGTGAKEAGSGAGLAIVKRIVEQHGGKVWIEGAPGVGADFRFTIPKDEALLASAVPAGQTATIVVR